MKTIALFLLLAGVLVARASTVSELLMPEESLPEGTEITELTEEDIDWESLRPEIEEWALSGEVPEWEDDEEEYEGDDSVDLVRRDVAGCSKGKCTICFKVWKLKGCIVGKLVGNGIRIEFQFGGRTIYGKTIRARNYTIRIKRSKLPRWLRKLIRSDLEIRVTGINPARKTFCVQVVLKVRWIGTIRWPKRRPKCVRL